MDLLTLDRLYKRLFCNNKTEKSRYYENQVWDMFLTIFESEGIASAH